MASENNGIDRWYRELAELAGALLTERNIGRMSEMVLLAAMKYCGADAGAFFDRSDEAGKGDEGLRFGLLHIRSLNIMRVATVEDMAALSPLPDPLRAAFGGWPVAVDDAQDQGSGFDPATLANIRAQFGISIRSLLAVPLTDSQGKVMAVLMLANAQKSEGGPPIPFDAERQTLIKVLAAQAGSALENLEIYKRVVSAGMSFTSERDPNALLERIVIEARRLAYADGCTLYLREGDRLRYIILHNQSRDLYLDGTTDKQIPYPDVPLKDKDGNPDNGFVAARAANAQQPVHVPDVTRESGLVGPGRMDEFLGYKTVSIYAVPLLSRQGTTIGVLELINAREPRNGHRNGGFTHFDRYTRSLVDALAGQAAVALDNQIVYQQLIETGISLSAERDNDRLMEKILLEAKGICNAEGGSLYLRHEGDETLHFTIVHNDVLGIAMGGKTGKAITFPPLRMYDAESGEPNHRNVATHVAISGKAVNIPDAYAEEGFDFSGTRAFDQTTGYRSKSFLTVPLKDRENQVIGVLQLINARDWRTHEVIPFSHITQPLVESLASQAAVALNNQQLFEAQRKLLVSFIQLIAGAIDAKSPYTGGHCQRVPELAKLLSEAAHNSDRAPFDDFRMSDEDRYELDIASLLHDCGKVTTPEYVVDKATKLETIYNRIHEVRMRFEVAKREAELTYWQAVANGADGKRKAELKARLDQDLARLDDDFAFIAECNLGGEFMDQKAMDRVREIAAQTWTRTIDDRLGMSWTEEERFAAEPKSPLPTTEPILADRLGHLVPRPAGTAAALEAKGFRMPVPDNLYNFGEVYNLCIARGTLNEEERFKINDHIVQTIIMLEELPFPRGLKRVPEYAGGHHEKMDGTGYPRRLAKDDMSLPARIMAVADIFEALTASDRPYKKAKTLSEAIKIMGFMKKDAHIDPDLFDLFLRSGAYRVYAEKFLHPDQIDEVDVSKYLEQ